MNTTQIQQAISSDPAAGPHFLGVFASDQIPRRISQFPASLVVNTDPSSERGEHWVAFYFDKHGNVEYFDSYGFAPINCELMRFFESNGKNHTWNKVQLQGLKSNVCGQWCIAYIVKRSRGQSRAQIIKGLKSDTKVNSDRQVGKLVNDAYNVKSNVKTHFQDGGGALGIQCCCSKLVRMRRKRFHL